MQCPVCASMLQPVNRQGIEIDTCPQCRGVWLDRGELDKLIQLSNQYQQQHYRSRDDDDDSGEHRAYRPQQMPGRDGYPQHQPPPQKPRKSFWGELFD
jgi:uncharacterized protein